MSSQERMKDLASNPPSPLSCQGCRTIRGLRSGVPLPTTPGDWCTQDAACRARGTVLGGLGVGTQTKKL